MWPQTLNPEISIASEGNHASAQLAVVDSPQRYSMPMYTQHFELSELPFSIAPNPRYLFLSPQHREALAHLLYGVGVGGGFVVLTGEVGMGKTTLCRALIDQLPQDVEIALIFNPRLSSRELLASICDELQISYSGPKASLKELIDALNTHLLRAHASGRRVLVLIDEAQNLRFDVLEQVRLLTNLETNQHKLLQIILVGQPELNDILDRPNLRQLAQRITARYHLEPLNLDATRDYIRHRLKVADARREIFTPGGVREIFRRSLGIPRLVNLIGDRALLAAYTLGKREVDRSMVRRAALELRGAGVGSRRVHLRRRLITLVMAMALALTIAAVGHYRDRFPDLPEIDWAKFLAWAKSQNEIIPAKSAPWTDQAAGQEEVAAEVRLMDLSGSREKLVLELLSLWGVTQPEAFRCGKGGHGEVRCQNYRGTWEHLVGLNVPAVLELKADRGGERFICIERLENDRVWLRHDGKSHVMSLEKVLSVWTGKGILAYRPLETDKRALQPGIRDSAVIAIREALDVRSDGPDQDRYDAALRSRVEAFQRQWGLRPDGMIGTLTLIGIEGHGHRSDIPRLVVSGEAEAQ